MNSPVPPAMTYISEAEVAKAGDIKSFIAKKMKEYFNDKIPEGIN